MTRTAPSLVYAEIRTYSHLVAQVYLFDVAEKMTRLLRTGKSLILIQRRAPGWNWEKRLFCAPRVS
jgi:hypothetical protein